MKTFVLICVAVTPITLTLSPLAFARSIEADSRLEASFGLAPVTTQEQVLIHKSTRAQSGIWNQRRQKKSWPSAHLAPRKPRKKLNPDSMAQASLG